MRILQITNSFYPNLGGQEKVVLEVSRGLVKKGHQVTVLTSNYLLENDYREKDFIEGIKIIRLKNNFWFGGYGYVRKLRGWLEKHNKDFDIVHCHGYNRYMGEFSIKFLQKKIPLIFSPHGFIHTRKNYFFKKVHDLTFGKILRKADYCTSLTKLDYKDYLKLGIEKENIVELPNGVDVKNFSKIDKKNIENFKQKYKINFPFLLYVGRIHKSKGLQYVVESIKNLDISLVIIGKDSGYKQKLEKIIHKNRVSNRIKFLGAIDERELISAYHSSEAFVLFSEWEGFGIVIIESMSAGLPLIVSNRGALPYLVKDEVNGLVAKFPDSKDLRRKIIMLIRNSELKKKISENGKEFSKDFSWENIIRKTEKLYKGTRRKWNSKK